MKINNLGFGSIKHSKECVHIQLTEKNSNIFDETKLNQLQEIHNQEKDVLFLKEIQKQNGRIHLTYEVPGDFMSLEQVKTETLPVRIAAIKKVLEMEPLYNEDWVSLHPSTVFFRPMTSIRFAYMDVFHMADHQEKSFLEQYKALAYSLISCQSYEAFLRHGVKAYKPKKIFHSSREQDQITKLIKTIEETETLKGLQRDLQDSYDYTQYQYFQDIVSIEKKAKSKFYAVLITAFLVVCLGAIGGYFINYSQQEALAKEYNQKLEMKELKIDKVHAVEEGNYKKAISYMKQMKESKKEITDFLLKHEQYQLALSHHPSERTLEKVVSILYENEQKEKLLDLKLEDNIRLSDEKAIITYDEATLESRKSFITDPSLANRMGRAFIQHDDLHVAQYLAKKFEDEALTVLIEEKKKAKAKQEKIGNVEEKIKELKQQKEKTDDEKEKKEIDIELKKADEQLKKMKG